LSGVVLTGVQEDYDYARNVYCKYNSLQRVSLMNRVDSNDHNLISGSFLNEMSTRLTELIGLEPPTTTTLNT